MASPEPASPPSSTAAEPALLTTRVGRVMAGSARLLELGDLSLRGRGAAIVGEHGALVRLLLQQASLEGGSLQIGGQEPRAALRSGALGLCRATLEWDPSWTVESALDASASLAGAPQGAARRTLNALRLGPRRTVRIERLTPLERRLLTLAAALVTEPRVVLLERPFSTLEDAAAELFETVLTAQLAKRSWIALLDLDGPWERRLCERADAGVVVVRAGHALGPFQAADWLGEADVFLVRTTGADDALVSSLRDTAGAAVSRGSAPNTLVVRGLSGRAIAELTARAGVALRELTPLGHGHRGSPQAG